MFKISKADSLIFNLFSLWLIVDTLNGFLLRNDIPISVSQVYKLFVAIFVLAHCYKHNKVKILFAWMVLYLILYTVNIIKPSKAAIPNILIGETLFFCTNLWIII